MDTGSERRALSRPGLTATHSGVNSSDIRGAIRARALQDGFDAVGFTDAALTEDAGNGLEEFLCKGYHGDMGWLEGRTLERANPRRLCPEARSVVVLGLNYGPKGDPLAVHGEPGHGCVSVYARGHDYHDLMKKRLRVLARWMADSFDCGVKLFVDTAPVMEKPLGQAAGIGWQGRHSNLVSRGFGSWLFLAEIYTTLSLAPDLPGTNSCGSCTACLTACPTDAFPEPYVLDARRCISYLTIEHKGHIPVEFRRPMGNRIYGCDDCLAACPWNKFARPTTDPALGPRLELAWPGLADLARLDDQGFRSVFAGSPVKRTGRERFIRNVLIAIGNSGRAQLAGTAQALIGDPSPLVRAMAVWALARLLDANAFADLRAIHAPSEPDADVRAEWVRGA